METRSYEELLAQVDKLQNEGRLSKRPTREEMIDWAYGNTKIENDEITRDVVERAVDAAYGHRF